MDTVMEDEPEGGPKPSADQEGRAANRLVQEQMLTALGQLNKCLERLEEQQSASSSAAVGRSSRASVLAGASSS